jgi:tetratricopeptide (TPR) repeat protein
MVAGFRPYRRYEHNASLLDGAIRRQESGEPLPPGTDPTVSAIVAKLLAPQIERRYGSADQIARDLNAFLRGEPTLAAQEHATAGQATTRIASTATAPRRADSVPTEPLPVRPHAPGVPPPAVAPQPTTPPRPQPRWRAVRIVVLIAGLVIAASETLALVRAERLREQLPALDISDLPHMKDEYDRIGTWTPLGLGSGLVRSALTSRMIALADRTIFEFRAETPAVAKAQWEQAAQCLDFATTVAPSNATVAGKRAYVRGQLARIAERHDEAIRSFRDSARLTPREPDPHLGLAMMAAYATYDLDGFTQALADAKRLGYTPGRRVRMWSGDLHMKLGDRAQAAAKKLSGAEKTEQLKRAAEDYGKCVEYFEGIRLFNSESNLRTCRRRQADVLKELDVPDPNPLGELIGELLKKL